MKIAYVIESSHGVSPYNGIRLQAKIWAEELMRQGHEVDLISPWNVIDWDCYDAIHIFGQTEHTFRLAGSLAQYNSRLFFSPIIDTIQPVFKYRLASVMKIEKLRMYSMNSLVAKCKGLFKAWFVRSHYEFQYVQHAYGIPSKDIYIIPLSYRTPRIPYNKQRKPFCLHVSKITDNRKNVNRLIDAAVKYKFDLVLAGSCSPDKISAMQKKIDAADNVSYVGRISDKQLMDLYSQAKVFALPSINEGVGMVAVEAAACGCDIVITKIGGPKEYYGGMAFDVDPYSVDAIGQAVCQAMECRDRQPRLKEMVEEKYSLENCVRLLAQRYAK
ncbi:Glycosyltransferase involved in cell wall bisynthesis [Fibrobacter sp. UWT3]|uniref:glycosyltransferase family 4 protein n=1 Tax=Fibrobacter sp. UWT3 TaxID=1896225 RepID=UPI000BCAD83D|nr:glycosyltransferase family 4 protein [Fibrobacter sp. UWT3]SOE51593.1 Glycosyltransferase involved in cell wall bisynthesis [Fibrobacter sp. UWT3]